MYIFLYLAAWINVTEISERIASEKFRITSAEGMLSQLSDERFTEFFKISGNYALFKINEHASNVTHPLKYNETDRLRHLKNAFFECVANGTSDEFENENLSYSTNENRTYTFRAWLDNLNSTLSQAGLEIKTFDIRTENFTQTSHVTFKANMSISIFVQDRLSTISLNRTFYFENEFNVTGFSDPMIKREYNKIKPGANITKQIFFTNKKHDDFAPINKSTGTYGQGFFYGTLINASDGTKINAIVDSERKKYILVGNFSDITSISNWSKFGAYILTNEPTKIKYDSCDESEKDIFNAIVYRNISGNCEQRIEHETDNPFVVIVDFDISKFSGPGNQDLHHALVITNASTGKNYALQKNRTVTAYDIEDLRDVVICTYFFNSTRAPSYPQRLTRNATELNDSNFGFETLLVGEWAGGKNLIEYENYSRTDFEFFRKINGEKVRGMPGCKSSEMCAILTGTDAPLGHFRLSLDSLNFYGIKNEKNIACNDGRVGCGN